MVGYAYCDHDVCEGKCICCEQICFPLCYADDFMVYAYEEYAGIDGTEDEDGCIDELYAVDSCYGVE